MESSLLLLPIGVIDEDPNQPRTEFDEGSLLELAQTIGERGVKTPISVRPHPDVPGRYLINHGARRFRASVLAGKEAIPAHVDAEYTEEDQLVENVQRENLSPREVAEFIGKLLARGRKKGEIARIIGKSPAYVTQHVTLLDLPEPVASVFENARCEDVTVINELVRLQKNYPVQTEAWLTDKSQEINRSSLKLLREFIESSKLEPQEINAVATRSQVKVKPVAPTLQRPALWGKLEGHRVKLLLNRVPTEEGKGWFKWEDSTVFEARLCDVHFMELSEDG